MFIFKYLPDDWNIKKKILWVKLYFVMPGNEHVSKWSHPFLSRAKYCVV